MILPKLQIAGGLDFDDTRHAEPGRAGALVYGGLAVGLLAGAAVSAYFWRQRVRALNLLNSSPLERAETLIESCESKLEDLERQFDEMKASR